MQKLIISTTGKKSDSSGICSKSDRPDGRRTEHFIHLSEVHHLEKRAYHVKITEESLSYAGRKNCHMSRKYLRVW